MSGAKRFGDPRKNQALENSKLTQGRSKRELSAGFLMLAWAMFFLLWWASGLLLAAIVFGVLLSGGIAVLNVGSS
jgi:hypothetical protein